MIVKNIILKNFRNYKDLKIDLSADLNLFIGTNGSGKTNILESLSVISNIKSFKNVSYSNLIKWNEFSFYCETNVLKNNNEKFSVGCIKENKKLKKKFKIDDSQIKKIENYYGKLLTIIYSPEDINLISGIPEIKRKYFDGIICKIDKNYFINLFELKKILNNRNILLKRLKKNKFRNYSQLDIWDELFIKRAIYIIKKRKEFIKEFSQYFREEYIKIFKDEYIPELNILFSLNENSEEELYKKLQKNRDKDLLLGTSGVGPHRDRYIFSLNNIEFKNYASQGQKRTAAFALKNSEKKYIEKITEKNCILLIDDIFAELDKSRRINIINLLEGKNQVLFTMVSKEFLNLKNRSIGFFNVENGNVNEI